MVIVLSYGALIGLVVALALTARARVLLEGRVLTRLNFTFVALSGAFVLVLDRSLIATWLLLTAVLLAISWASSETWLLFGTDPERTRETIKSSFARVLVAIREDGSGYAVDAGAARLSIRISQPLGGVVLLRFFGSWQENRPRLARSYLAKQFRGVLPVLLRIRL